MKIYFAQHGFAESKEVNPDRPLSEKGRLEVEKVAERLKDSHVLIKEVYNSGKLRSFQTAEIFTETDANGYDTKIEGMNPNDDAKAFADSITEGDVMYVGHLPHLEKVISYMIAGDENAQVIKMTNAGVACVEKDENGARLLWYLCPSLCR